MVRTFWPDWYFESYNAIPEGFFKRHGIKYLISDIDNTLVSYMDRLPTPNALAFFKRLEEEGVTLLLASNNSKKRVRTFSGKDIPSVYRAGKPATTHIRIMMHKEKVRYDQCAFMGDQLFTDCLAAKRLGIPMILVKPVKNDRALPIFGIKRDLESLILRKYLKEYSINCIQGRRGIASKDLE
ncbi:MAG: HAD-IIIA family hydrolase [Clostridia bacterium]|nr:HAD-IIIA family hydrolase [Clostridia bacterium]